MSDPSESGARPSVGNILGFALQFNERRAQLILNRRGLMPGVKLRDYVAEIPNVRLPIRGAITASAYRHRRCRAVAATISVEPRAVLPWLSERLVGAQVDGVEIRSVAVELRRRLPHESGSRPCVMVEGRRADGGFTWALFGLSLQPEGRFLSIRPGVIWYVGARPNDAGSSEASTSSESSANALGLALWSGLARRIAPELEVRDDGSVLVDPSRLALTRSFVSSGWKAPNLASLALDSLTMSRRALTFEMRAGDDAGGEARDPEAETGDRIGPTFDELRTLLDAGRHDDVLSVLEQVSSELEAFPAAALAVARWRVELSRWRAPAHCARAVETWLALQPNDQRARRILMVALARAEDSKRLAAMIAADHRTPQPPRSTARLELALTTLLTERLGDPRSALSVAGPLVQRLRSDPALADLLPEALTALAQARTEDACARGGTSAPHAIEALREALELTTTPERRSDLRARVASAFARHGVYDQALELLLSAIADDPDTLDLLDDAIEYGERLGELNATAQLLRLRVDRSTPAAPELRARLAQVLRRIGDPAALVEARDQLRAALEVEPESAALLRLAATIERDVGADDAAAETLERLLDVLEPEDAEWPTVSLQLGSLLFALRRYDDAWDVIRPLLVGEGTPDLETLELALELAPPTERSAILDALVEHSAGERRSRALLERAAQAYDVADRVRDLWLAAEEMEDPSATLAQIDPLIADDDFGSLERLLDVAVERGSEAARARAAARVGHAFYWERHWQRAAECLNLTVALEPARMRSRAALARTLDELELHVDAHDHRVALLDWLASDPDLSSVEPTVPTPFPDRVEVALHVARAQLADGKHDAALETLDHHATRPPEALADSVAEVRLVATMHQGDPDATLEYVREHLRDLDSGDPRRGVWLMHGADLSSGAERLSMLREAAALRPDDPTVTEAYRDELRASIDTEEREAFLRRYVDRVDSVLKPDVLVELLQVVGTSPERDADRVELFHALIEARPGDPEAHFELAQLHRRLGAIDEASAQLERFVGLADEDDPRRIGPLLELAASADANGDLSRALLFAEEAAELAPSRHDAWDAWYRYAHTHGDERGVARAGERRLDWVEEAHERATLHLAIARAGARNEHPDPVFEHLASAAKLAPSASALHLEIAELWIDVALKHGRVDQETAARAQLRAALGPSLAERDLLIEVALLRDHDVDGADALLGGALVERGAPAAILEALLESAGDPDDVERHEVVLEVLASSLGAMPNSAGTVLLAESIVPRARALGHAEQLLAALDRLDATPARLELRDWAVRAMGDEDTEVRRVEATLVDHPDDDESVSRLVRLLDDEGEAAAHLLEIAEQAPGRGPAILALKAISLAATARPALALDAFDVLCRHGDSESVVRGWERIVVDLEPATQPAPVSRITTAAVRVLEERERLDPALREALVAHPDDEELHQAAWARVLPVDHISGSEDATNRAVDLYARYLDAIGFDEDAATHVALLEGARHVLDAERLPDWLSAAAGRFDPDDARAELAFTAMETRRFWPAAVRTLSVATAPDLSVWERVAEGARTDADAASERAARWMLADALEREERTTEALDQLVRLVELAPEDAALRWRCAEACRHADLGEQARGHYLRLIDDESWAAAGVAIAELALRGGEACIDSDPERAIELLMLARDRGLAENRDALAAQVFDVMIGLELEYEAWKLAMSAAADAQEEGADPGAELAWIERALPLCEGRERVDLLERAMELDDNPERRSALEDELTGLDDLPALEAALRSRLAVGVDVETLRRLITVVEASGTKRASDLADLRSILLTHAPEDTEAMLELAEYHLERGEHEPALGLWRRAIELLPANTPELLEPYRHLAEHAVRTGELETAREWFERVIELDARDFAALRGLLKIARYTADDALRAETAESMLAMTPGGTPAARLERDLGEARAQQGAFDIAAEAFRRGCDELDPGSVEHIELARAWVESAGAARESTDEAGAIDFELRARAELRTALGDRVERAELDQGVELLLEAGAINEGCELLESLLRSAPSDVRWRERLRSFSRSPGGREPYLRALRGVADATAAGSIRDDVARELALAARDTDAARTALLALDRLSGAVASSAEMLDVRDWAIRSLGRVDEELAELEAQLLERDDDLVATRILRMVEHDPQAYADRLLALAERADEPGRSLELANRSLAVFSDTGRPGPIRAHEIAAAAGGGPEPFFQRRVDLALEQSDHESLVELYDLAVSHAEDERWRDRPWATLCRALVARPDDPRLHERLVAARSNATPAELADTVEELADLFALDDRVRARLLVGMFEIVGDAATEVIIDRAARHRDRVAIYESMVSLLRARHELDALASIYDDAAPDSAASNVNLSAWEELAADAHELGRYAIEARALARAGAILLEHGQPERAAERLRRSLDRAESPAARRHLARALEDCGEEVAALDQLRALIPGADPEERLALARRCVELAHHTDDRALQIETLSLAISHAEGDPLRNTFADALFTAHLEGDQRERAAALAVEMAGEVEGDDRVRWLLRAADLVLPAERAGLLEAAQELRPEDREIATQLARVLEELGDVAATRRALLRRVEVAERDEKIALLEHVIKTYPPLLRAADEDEDEVDPETLATVAELHERIVRHDPDHGESRLALGHHRARQGDDAAALGHWRRAAALLDDCDPRVLVPVSALADEARRNGNVEETRRYLERALRIDSEDPAVWSQLLDVARALLDGPLTIRASRALLEVETDATRRAALMLELGSAQQALGDLEGALAAARIASEEDADEVTRRRVAETWLSLARNTEIPETLARNEEVDARAFLRDVMGSELPPGAVRREAELLATRLERPEAAMEILSRGLIHHPRDFSIYESLEALGSEPGREDAMAQALASVVEQVSDGPVRARAADRLARLAGEREDAELCLLALDALPIAQTERGELLRLRDWAVRSVGRVDDEIQGIEERLLREPNRDLAFRLVRLCDDLDGAAARLAALVKNAAAPIAAPIAALGLEVVRAEAPDRLDPTLVLAHCVIDTAQLELLGRWWPEIETLASTSTSPEAAVEVCRLAERAAASSDRYVNRCTTVLNHSLGRHPSTHALHETLLRLERASKTDGDPLMRSLARLDALAGRIGPTTTAAAELVVAFSRVADMSDDARAQVLFERASHHPNTDAAAVFRAALQELGRWRELLRLVTDVPRAGGSDLQRTEELAARSADAGDLETAVAARQLLGRAHFEHERYDLAVDQLTTALELAPEHDEIRYLLARALDMARRPDAALEHYLRLMDPEICGQIGIELDALGARAGDLLLAIGHYRRAAEVFATAFDHAKDDRRWYLADARFRALMEAGERAAALEVADHAQRSVPGDRIRWLRRAAELAAPAESADYLQAALELTPADTQLAVDLEGVLRGLGDDERLMVMLRRRLDLAQNGAIPEDSAALARRVLSLGDPPDQTMLYDIILAQHPDDVDALLGLANARREEGDADSMAHAFELWRRAGTLLPRDDDRFYEPAHAMSVTAIDDGELLIARDLLERALVIRPGDRDTLIALRECATRVQDERLLLRTARALLDDPSTADQRAALEFECGESLLHLGSPEEAFGAFERAVDSSVPGSEDQIEYARRWVAGTREGELPLSERARMDCEVSSRAALRAAMGDGVERDLVIAEARLLVQGLARFDEGLSLLDAHVGRWPLDETYLSCFKELSRAASRSDTYAAALQRLLEGVEEPAGRDQLARDLAFTSLDENDAAGVLSALGKLSASASADPELLDLRDWAIRNLGQLEDELSELDRDLLRRPTDEVLLQRLVRTLDRNIDSAAAHLLRLDTQHDQHGSGALVVAAIDLLLGSSSSRPEPLVECARALRAGNGDAELAARWATLAQRVLAKAGPEILAELADVGFALEATSGDALEPGPLRLIERAWQYAPDLQVAHATYWKHVTGEDEEMRIRAAEAVLEKAAESRAFRGEAAAKLWIGFARELPREGAAALISRRAGFVHDDPERFGPLVGALEQRNYWPEAFALWETHAERASDERERVAALKHLANASANVIGDANAAVDYLVRALHIDAEDPDLLLPLLDLHYASSTLDKAIALTRRVLDVVPMGSTAFGALGNRAADAALALGDQDAAQLMLERVLERAPSDARTKRRLEELRVRATDPEHRIQMLDAIANRQTGAARHEALEERARLLVDPLERIDEAVVDLETLLAEVSSREAAATLLADLYRRRGRWADLVALLEREFPASVGDRRTDLLLEIADVYHDRLLDLGRAEQALRLALESLTDDDDALIDDARADRALDRLAHVYEQQGRYGEVVTRLRARVDPIIESDEPLDDRTAPLAEHLARALREYADDAESAARIYAKLEAIDRLPPAGLATLARWYRAEGRHDDLVRILKIRSSRLGEVGDRARKADADIRIGELLEGPLRRPHEAADFFLNAYLSDPVEHPEAGRRARVLLAGTDSVLNVRNRLLERASEVLPAHRPALLTLLADLLAPHEDHEAESEKLFRRAIELDGESGVAHEGLGRLLARQGRLEDAAGPLTYAATTEALSPTRAADNAATAARVLHALGRLAEAEQVLKQALARAPDAERALLELARLYDKEGRREDEADVLETLSQMALSSILRAEVAYRRAMLLEAEFRADPLSQAGEAARSLLLEAVSSDSMHAQARHVLLELATRRSEWSIVAHMHYLSIRELPPGPQRAQTHLDLAETYLDRLADHESATRNLASSIAQSGGDRVIEKRAYEISTRLPQTLGAAARVQKILAADGELEPEARGRMWLFAADLWLRGEDVAKAEEAALNAVEEAEGAESIRQASERFLDSIAGGTASARKEKAALLRLLEAEDVVAERMGILARLHALAVQLEDDALASKARNEQFELATRLVDEEPLDDALAHLREFMAEQDDFERVTTVYQSMAESHEAEVSSRLLTEAARFAWTGARDPKLAVSLLRTALRQDIHNEVAADVLGEIMSGTDGVDIDDLVFDESGESGRVRSPTLTMRVAESALRTHRPDTAREALEGLIARGDELDPQVLLQAMRRLDEVLSELDDPAARLGNLERLQRMISERDPAQAADVATALARMQLQYGRAAEAAETCRDALLLQPTHFELMGLYSEVLEITRQWPILARTFEQLAGLTTNSDERLALLVRAAQIHVEHGADPTVSLDTARHLLLQAINGHPDAWEPLVELLPIAFSEKRWDETLSLGERLIALRGAKDLVLVCAAFVEAYRDGRRTIARQIGTRHSAIDRNAVVWPAAQTMLERVAREGPLPRLDAIIGAAAAMCGGAEELGVEFRGYAMAHELRAGTSLALARLEEAFGHPEVARNLYQVAGVLALEGPIPDLVRRLPAPELPVDLLRHDDWIPLEWRCALREVLIQLRTRLAGIRPADSLQYVIPESAAERATIQSAGRTTARWREQMGMPIPIRMTRDKLRHAIAVRNETEPLIVIHGDFIHLPEAERAYRLAHAATGVATGLALADDSYPGILSDLLEALEASTQPRIVPDSPGAKAILEGLARSGFRASQLKPELREGLIAELGHWRNNAHQLDHVIRRARALLAARVCGRLDGALMAIARDARLLTDLGDPDCDAALRTEDGLWLLRAVGVGGTPAARSVSRPDSGDDTGLLE